uniref:Uncharacterized protein n=1 Tax=Oryza punctata TaxID=4537 RepID=A0A0E0LGN4_ORYPU
MPPRPPPVLPCMPPTSPHNPLTLDPSPTLPSQPDLVEGAIAAPPTKPPSPFPPDLADRRTPPGHRRLLPAGSSVGLLRRRAASSPTGQIWWRGGIAAASTARSPLTRESRGEDA